MKTKQFSLEDVRIIHGDILQENGLSEIVGGISESAVECVCECFIGNSNEQTKDKDKKANLQM